MFIGYARVSTQDQTPQLQLDALKAAGCERSFVEKASGAQRDRPELQAALEYMRSGDTLIVWKLDRLARSLKQLIETVESLENRKMGFRSLTENIDTTTPGGRLTFHLFAALAEFERSIIKERTMAGLAAARARGRKGGRPPSLNAKDLAAAKAMLSDPAITVEEVAKRLKVSPATLYRHLPGGRGALSEGAA
ncbi:MAG TPA: recombinase family protein [Rhodopila sp.]|nr:recombinase family protein [Rhodopila sp.]